jgi:hypothetical protein
VKTQTIAWADFPWQSQGEQQRAGVAISTVVIPLAVMVLASVEPAHAAGWEYAKTKILWFLDRVAYGDIVFCGGMWMFGHRNKALDLLLSCGIGTVIIRHADDIEAFFESI